MLGPTEVRRDGEPVRFRGRRELALIALLAIEANRLVPTDRLIEDLWGDTAPEGALRTLRVYVSRVRQALGDAGELLVTRPTGYLFRVEPGAIDALRFEALVREGRRQVAAGDHTSAAATFQAALGLWRGPALADLAEVPSAVAQAARLEEDRLAALEERIDADLACGRHGEMAAELEVLTRAHPLRERIWGQRITALYRAGRQADALRAYQQLRSTLGEQLGIEPSSALQHLEGAVLRHDPELDWHPGTGRPGATASDPLGPDAGKARAAEGVVTFLFTDLVGSTELLDELGEDGAEEARHAHFGLLRDAVAAHGGSEVKSLGDGLMVAFESPLAALRCAVEIQKTAAGAQSRAEKPLAVRVGLHAGQPMRDEADFHGTPVVVAKRLCDRAEGGQVLASVLISDLIGSRRDEFAFRHLGPLPLKGLAVPVAACEVVPRAAAETAPSATTTAPGPLPQPLAPKERLPLVGREIELSRLDQMWQATRSGQRQLLLLAGEPGIGKSRLSAEFARTAYGGGAAVLFGRCDEGMGVPYQPFVEALSRYLRQAPQVALGRLAGELVRLLPEVGERIHGLPPPLRSDPETERYRLFDAVAAWLGAVSETAPVLFVIEDLHWATKPTLLLLSHLLRSDEDLHLLLLTTFRDTPLDMTPDLADLVAELLRQPGVERIRLAGLDESGVGALMEAQAGHDLDDEGWALARIVRSETAGNPFYVREMLRLLAEKGDIVRRDGRWVPGQPLAQLDVPDSVRDVVERRLTRLPDRTSEMLALAAVLGERFDLPLLAQASGESESSVIQALRPAVSARLVNETDGGSYQFTHALVRSALEDALGPTRGVQLHRAAGLAVEAVHAGHLEAHLPQLAHHFARGRDVHKAIEYASRAGDRALAQLAHDEAASYYASALELLDAAGADDADHRRLELLIGRGEAQRRAGDPSFRQTLLDAAHLAIRLGDNSALARAALANGRGSIYSTSFAIDTARVAVLESAIERLASDDLALRARVLSNLGLELCWERDARRRIALSDEAVRVARQLADRSTLAVVLLARDYTIHDPANAAERFRATTELLTLAEGLRDPVLTSRALALRFKASVELTDIAEAERSLVRNEAVVAELGQPALTWAVMVQRAGLALLRGDLSVAETTANAAYEHAVRTGQPDAIYWFLPQHMQLRVEQARMAEVEEIVRSAAEKVDSPAVKAIYGGLLLEAGRWDDASEVFEELATTNFDAPRPSSLWLRFAAECAVMSARLGRPASVPQLQAMLEPYADQVVTTSQGGAVTGSVSYYLGLLAATIGDWPQAEARFATAAATHARIDAPIWLARTRMEHARMLLLRGQLGDSDRARELLGQALATTRDLGLAKVERDTVALLQECP
ncbi:MAG: BTAD domain-containing putative transcriptional regulator [Acidimicrobiia bacterium]